MSRKTLSVAVAIGLLTLAGCGKVSQNVQTTEASSEANMAQQPALISDYQNRLDIYHPVDLTADLSHLSDNQRKMLSILIDASKIMDDLFWQQSYGGKKKALLNSLQDPKIRAFAAINYGPWDRLNGDKPFLTGVQEKPPGAQFYPADMTKEHFERVTLPGKKGLYSVIERSGDALVLIPYSIKYSKELTKAAELLREAATLADDPEFANYLTMRAEALLTDDYQASDFAWMDMKNNPIELVYGPIETYEDQLFGYRAAFESYVLVKDMAWSDRLAKYAAFLPELQAGLPVDAQFKQEKPGTDADLNAYDVIYYAGHSNAGSKTIAINLPNDEEVQLSKGTRRLQLKNAMQAKFDHILVPIADELIVPEQRKHITFDAFFANTMFHEVAHGLGIKNTINDKGTVRQALKEHASALEEGKADILGLYMVEQLLAKGEISEGVLQDYYTTFMAGIFRSVRFGASSAHGKANMVRFNYFQEQGAFHRNEAGLYSVDMEKMQAAVQSLSKLILTLQGTGDYDGVAQLVAEKGVIKADLQADLDRLSAASIPVDITFNQGKEVLGLE
ncbi:MAG: Zn-dependent hydrolase [Aestuariibacter sp.]